MMVWLIGGCLAAGLALNALAVAGTLRFPDVYTRAHALGIADTLGALLVLAAVAGIEGPTLASAKILLLMGILFFINPTVIHTVLQAALESGVRPWGLRKDR